MKQILAAASQPLLAQLARERTLCAFDFDGTLAPIVQHPSLAKPRRKTIELLNRLCQLYPCIVVSGRARQDIAVLLQGVPVARLYGNHGAEGEPGAKPLARIAGWRRKLAEKLEHIPGVWVEDKGISLAVHYRESPDKHEARRAILAATAELQRARVFGGKQVVNLTAGDAADKGRAVESERRRLKCDWVLYVGDDDNDEPAFALPGNVVAVRVGRKQSSAAAYYLRTQREIDDLLSHLVQLRKSSSA